MPRGKVIVTYNAGEDYDNGKIIKAICWRSMTDNPEEILQAIKYAESKAHKELERDNAYANIF